MKFLPKYCTKNNIMDTWHTVVKGGENLDYPGLAIQHADSTGM